MARNHVRHFKRHERDRQCHADPEAALHVHVFGIGLFFQRHRARLERHAALRARAGLVPHHFGMHRTDVLRLRLRSGNRCGLERHAAFRAHAGLWLMDFLVHRAGVVGAGNGLGSLVLGFRRTYVVLWRGAESFEACLAAEVIGGSLVLVASRRSGGLNIHLADGVLMYRAGFRAAPSARGTSRVQFVTHRLSLHPVLDPPDERPADWLIRPASRMHHPDGRIQPSRAMLQCVHRIRPAAGAALHPPASTWRSQTCSLLLYASGMSRLQSPRPVSERRAADYKCPREAKAGALKNRLRLEFKKRLTEQAAGDNTAPDARCCKFWT